MLQLFVDVWICKVITLQKRKQVPETYSTYVNVRQRTPNVGDLRKKDVRRVKLEEKRKFRFARVYINVYIYIFIYINFNYDR